MRSGNCQQFSNLRTASFVANHYGQNVAPITTKSRQSQIQGENVGFGYREQSNNRKFYMKIKKIFCIKFLSTTLFSIGLKIINHALNFLSECVQLEDLCIKWKRRIVNIYFISKRKLMFYDKVERGVRGGI